MSRTEVDGSASETVGKVDQALHDQFTWYPVAKKDFKDAIRSRGLVVLAALFTIIFIAPIAVRLYFEGFGPSPPDGGLETRAIIQNIYLNLVTVVLPVVTIFVGAAAITKEKTSGSLKVLLSLPFSRRSVLIGKVVGRGAVVAVPFLIASSVTAVFIWGSKIPLNLEMYALFMFFSLLFAVVMVAIAVSISAAVSTTLRSLIVNAIFYVYVSFGWNSLANEIGQFMYNDLGVSRALRWNTVLFIKLASPTQAYKTLVSSMMARFSDNVQPGIRQVSQEWSLGLSQLSAQQYSRYTLFDTQGSFLSPGLPAADKRTLCENVIGATYNNVTFTANNQTQTVSAAVNNETVTTRTVNNLSQNGTQMSSYCTGGSDLPFYLSDPAVALFMLGWIGLAAAVGYYTFAKVDL